MGNLLVSVQHNVKSEPLSLAAIKPPQTTITSLWPRERRILGHDRKSSCTIQVTEILFFSLQLHETNEILSAVHDLFKVLFPKMHAKESESYFWSSVGSKKNFSSLNCICIVILFYLFYCDVLDSWCRSYLCIRLYLIHNHKAKKKEILAEIDPSLILLVQRHLCLGVLVHNITLSCHPLSYCPLLDFPSLQCLWG